MLQDILPRFQNQDISVFAEFILFLNEQIQVKEVDWLAWEDPFILGRDAAKLKREREQSLEEPDKRLGYAVEMLRLLHKFLEPR
ncbi:hypothetical protein KFU94_59770 [Chloroflexi bacterium TSY]|nr:hypothetical protein [Chloroflexi bacterium TSY]